MRYLVSQPDLPPFFTDVFSFENNFIKGHNCIVFDLIERVYIDDSGVWKNIEYDSL